MNKIFSFEGLHGAGKTTQINMLKNSLSVRGHSVELRNQGDKRLSEYIMRFLEECGPHDPETWFYLAMAHDFEIQEKLKANKGVFLLDRYLYTSIASTNLLLPDMEWIYNCLKPFVFPDNVFLLDVTPEEALRRKNGDVTNLERGRLHKGLEGNFLDYQKRLRDSYLEVASKDKRVIVFDGSRPPERINDEILEILGVK